MGVRERTGPASVAHPSPDLSRKSSPNGAVNKFAGIDVAAQDGQHQLKADKAGIIGRPVLHGTLRPPSLSLAKNQNRQVSS
jgi:hypothetical protein